MRPGLASGRELVLLTLPGVTLAYCTSLFFGELFAIELKMWGPQIEGTMNQVRYESIYSVPWPTGTMLGGTPPFRGGA